MLIADGTAIFREGLRRVLTADAGFEIAGAPEAAEEVELAARDAAPDVLLLALDMLEAAGLEILPRIASRAPAIRVVILGTGVGAGRIVELLRLGVRGVVKRDSPIELLRKSIRCVSAGEYWLPRDATVALVRSLGPPRTEPSKPSPANFSGLTPREREILALLVAGCRNKDIAEKCSVRQDTVKHHLTSIFAKTGAANRLELALFAIHRGVVAA